MAASAGVMAAICQKVEDARVVELLDDLRADARQFAEIVGRATRRGEKLERLGRRLERVARRARRQRPELLPGGASASPKSTPAEP